MNRKLKRLSQLVRIASALSLALVLLALPCAHSSAVSSRVVTTSPKPPFSGSVFGKDGTHSTDPSTQSTREQIGTLMTEVNAQLEATGADYRVDYAEYLTPDDSGEAGHGVIFSNRGNKQLGSDFVPGDPRRLWGGGTNITYTVDQTEGAIDGLTAGQTTAAIDRAVATWDGVNCSTIPITKLANPGSDIGIIEFINGLGGSPFIFADITHAGWLRLPAPVLPPPPPPNPPDGILSDGVLAVTFTFSFVSGGVPTDIDNNGKRDTAFREILYNDSSFWRINPDNLDFFLNIDVETVALHEMGHGLSQAHFGRIVPPGSQGQFAPRAVMNGGYTGIQQNIEETDLAGHCSIWASWPNH